MDNNEITGNGTPTTAPNKTSASHCYDCGKAHPAWVQELLEQMWNEGYEFTDEEIARLNDFSNAEHGECFK